MRVVRLRRVPRASHYIVPTLGGIVALMLMFAPWVAFAAVASTRQKSESFDHDPEWDQKNNRWLPNPSLIVEQDFGYGATNQEGQALAMIGGKFSQSLRPSYYAQVIASNTLDNALTASGTVSITEAAAVSGWASTANIYVGWFNADAGDLIWRPRNFLGFRLQSFNEPDGALVELTYGTGAWQAGGMFVNAAGGGQERLVRDLKSSALLRIPPDRSRHRWKFRYEPDGANGAGEIIFLFDDAETRFPLERPLRQAGASFNRFGFFTPRIPGRHMVVWFSDLNIGGQRQDLSLDPTVGGSW